MAYAGGAAAPAAAAQEARKALIGGLLVEMEEDAFLTIASEQRHRICVHGEVGTIKRKTAYALSIDGLVLYTTTDRDLSVMIPNRKIKARKIRIPSI